MYPAHFMIGAGRPTSKVSRSRLKKDGQNRRLGKDTLQKEERVTLPDPLFPPAR